MHIHLPGVYAYADTDSNPYSYWHSDANSYGNADGDPDSHAKARSDAATSPECASSPDTVKKQRGKAQCAGINRQLISAS